MQKDLEVKSKGLSGKDDKPYVTLQSSDGTKVKLILQAESDLEEYQISDIVTVKFVKEQTQLR